MRIDMGEMAETGESATLRKAYEAALKKYGENLERLRTQVETERGTHAEMVGVFAIGFGASTVDLMRSGLEIYIDAAAKDRASAATDREQQEKDRRTMGRLTMAIMGAAFASAFGTIWGAFHPPKAESPIINLPVPPAPIVQISPVPVNVTLVSPTAPAGVRTSGKPRGAKTSH